MGRDSEKRAYPINNRTYGHPRFKNFTKMNAKAKPLLFQIPGIDTSLLIMVNNKHLCYCSQNWSRPTVKIPDRASSVQFTSCHNSLEALTRFPSTPCILRGSFPTHTTFLMHTREADYKLRPNNRLDSIIVTIQIASANDIVPSNITSLKFQLQKC